MKDDAGGAAGVCPLEYPGWHGDPQVSVLCPLKEDGVTQIMSGRQAVSTGDHSRKNFL